MSNVSFIIVVVLFLWGGFKKCPGSKIKNKVELLAYRLLFYSLANEEKKNVLHHYLNNQNKNAVKLFHSGVEIAS